MVLGHNSERLHAFHICSRWGFLGSALPEWQKDDMETCAQLLKNCSQNFTDSQTIHRYPRLFRDSGFYCRFHRMAETLVLQSLKTQQTQQFVRAINSAAYIFCAPRTLCSTSGAKMWNTRSRRSGTGEFDVLCVCFTFCSSGKFGIYLCPWKFLTFLFFSPVQIHRSLTLFLLVVLVFLAKIAAEKWDEVGWNEQQDRWCSMVFWCCLMVSLAGLRLMAVWTARESRGIREEVQGSDLMSNECATLCMSEARW